MPSHYKNLVVFQTALDLAEEAYRLTDGYPHREWFNLVDQMRRAAVSVVSNIAEGRSRDTDRDFIHFLYMARGSCSELEAQTYLSIRLNYITVEQAQDLLRICDRESRALMQLIKRLKESSLR